MEAKRIAAPSIAETKAIAKEAYIYGFPLPAPKGPFATIMRLYWPKDETVDGKWKQPPLKKAE